MAAGSCSSECEFYEYIPTQDLAAARAVGGSALDLGRFFRARRLSADRDRSAAARSAQAADYHGHDGDLPIIVGAGLVDSRAEVKPAGRQKSSGRRYRVRGDLYMGKP